VAGRVLLAGLTSNGLYGVISEKIVLFINTAVRTSNPTTMKSVRPLKPVSWISVFRSFGP
jgi:hypothetical protein